ncbi:MAG TPA: M28 family peptidase [Gemmatimonadaceae bacterium]
MNVPTMLRSTLVAAAAFTAACSSQPRVETAATPGVSRTVASITPTDLKTRLLIFADDSMMGREAGTLGNFKGTAYIASELARMGLEPAGDSGTYFQEIHATTARFAGSPNPAWARNVVAIIRGSDPTLRNEYVAIGAHNDAIGTRPAAAADHDSLRAFNVRMTELGAPIWDRSKRGLRDSLRATVKINVDSLHQIRPARRDSIINGADDDGSGSVTVLEIAEAINAMPVKPKRSILLVWHTAEEKGLLGSKWYTEHPTVPRSQIVAQLNIDMVGRGSAADLAGGGPDYLQLVGSRRVSSELGDIVEAINTASSRPFKFDYQFDANGHPERIYCRSDHYNYARYGIPITFFTTGLHPDYHQITDEVQYVDFDHMNRVANFIRDIAIHVANLDHRLKVDKPVGDPNATCVQ